MKKAFTLVELLLVIGLMGLMGTIAVVSYSAASRGMADRAALDAAKSIADAAVERARLDQTRTYLYLFDEVVAVDGDLNAGTAQGLMVAVRATGRISAVVSDLYCDEYNLERIESTTEFEDDDTESGREGSASENEENATVTRVYRLVNGSSGKNGFMTVYEGNFTTKITDIVDLDEATDNSGDPDEASTDWKIYGFKKVSGEEGSATFKVGDLYGKEFAVTRLPPNYTFSKDVRMDNVNDLGQELIKVIEVDPEDEAKNLPVEIFHRLPDGTFKSIGNISQVEKNK